MTSSDETRYFLDEKGEVWQQEISYKCRTAGTGLVVMSREEWEEDHQPTVELFPATNPSEEAVRVAPTSWPADLPPYGTVITPSVDPEPDHRVILAGRYRNKKIILFYDLDCEVWQISSRPPVFASGFAWAQLRSINISSITVIGAIQQ